MKYVTSIFGLNIPCNLKTMGDWHVSALKWENPTILESDDLPFGDYGIEFNKKIPEHKELYNVANHIRACLDMLYLGKFGYAQGMNNVFISNSKYDDEIFEKVLLLKKCDNFDEINKFMLKEYKMKWLKFSRRYGLNERLAN